MRPVARVICRFGAEREVRRLYATEMSLGGAFVLSMQPPVVGETVELTLVPSGYGPLSPIGARVIRSQVDPAAPERSGFEVVFTHLDDNLLSSLSSVLGALGQAVSDQPVVVERRAQPRVRTQLVATVEVGRESRKVNVLDLSMSGALLSFGPDFRVDSLPLGARLVLSVMRGELPEAFSVSVQVVRFSRGDEGIAVGVLFQDLDERTRARVEGVMLEALTE